MENKYIDSELFKKALKGAESFLNKNKEEINALNVFPVPDGDTGTNMSLTMKAAAKEGLELADDNVSKIARAVSHGSLMGARGNSGVILSQIFRGFSLGLGDSEKLDVNTLAMGFIQASETAYNAVMKPTEGTILTVARECGEEAKKLANRETDVLVFLRKIIEHGNKTLEKTPEMLPVLKDAGVVDAGGKGLMTVLIGGYKGIVGELEEELEENLEEQKIKYQEVVEHKHLNPEDIKFGYCTEFMINGEVDRLTVDGFRTKLSDLGDSLMVVQSEDIVKVHVHTNNPGRALEEAVKLGSLMDIKIDNMRMQSAAKAEAEEVKPQESKKYSFVAVSTGDGIENIFKSLNVDKIVTGGQTMNPSTEDIAKAINQVAGENVFVLPNNGNIILAAEQSRELTEKNVVIIPTKTIPQGISALFEFNEESSVEENRDSMLEAIGFVQTGQVTYAVRDSKVNGVEIKEKDAIGLLEGDIVTNGTDMFKVSEELIDSMVNEDSSLITILYGEDVEEESAQELEELLMDKYEDLDIELIYGGQPIYYYIFSVE